MRNFIYGVINSLIPGLLFTTATIISAHNYIIGTIVYILAYISLDLHSYIDKKLNYYNNLFIKH